jgi:SAM-dependent methyltransferase
MAAISFKHAVANCLGTRLKSVKSGYLGAMRFQLIYWAYHILPYLGYDYPRKIEWDFLLRRLQTDKNQNILDIGSSSSLFLYKLTQYGKTWGIDARPFFEKVPGHITFVQCDVLGMPFADNFFDFVSFISVVEHIGLGGYGDPLHDNGDSKAMREIGRVLKTAGTLVLTTVIANEYVTYPTTRIYDQQAFDKLIAGFDLGDEQYYIFRKRWIQVSKQEAFNEVPQRFGLACVALTKREL